MISARGFAAQSSIWHRATPTLEQFTRWANRTRRPYGWAIHSSTDPDRASLVAEMAFELAASGAAPSLEVEQGVVRYVQRLPGATAKTASLSSAEREEAVALQYSLERFLRPYRDDAVFRPSLAGCGVVEAAQADVMSDGHLMEVKSVQRGFRGLDFRQVLTYAALAHAASIVVTRVSLVNPRMAWSFTSSAEGLALDIGAGSWIELMQDLIDGMTDQGVSL